MKTKTIFKTLALAMMMPAMMLTTACSNDDDALNNTANTENTINKGYALPVTVNVTREGDAATRATYTDNGDGTGSLAFSAGDKLFVYGSTTAAGSFAGTLNYVPASENFSGTIYTEKEWTGTPDALFAAASAGDNLTATLLPNYYESTGFLSINNNSTTGIAYDDRLTVSGSYAFVASETAKATGVEQLSLEQASTYSSAFALSPGNAILNFTITGLEAGAKDVLLHIHHGFDYDVFGSVTPNASGVATFAIGVPVGANIKEMSNNLTVGSSNFTLPSSTTFAAGKIYNITRAANAINGKFTINSSGDQVVFSPGNLQYQASTNTWRFAEHQYDYVGDATNGNVYVGSTKSNNANISSSYDGWIDLFGWGTSNKTFDSGYGPHYQPWSTSMEYANYGPTGTSNGLYGAFANGDWGVNMTGTYTWRTLTGGSGGEWEYIFNTRTSGATVNGTSNARYTHATINTDGTPVNGMILFPDGCNINSSSATSWGNINSASTWDNATKCTIAQWTHLEEQGCVFLPAAGYRDDHSVGLLDSYGIYFSSSPHASNGLYAHIVRIYSGGVEPATFGNRCSGFSVRLVRDVAAPAPANKLLSDATAEDIGKVIGVDGKIYANVAAAQAASTTACAIIAYVGSETAESQNHGLAIAMKDAASYLQWKTSSGNNDNPKQYTDAASAIAAKESGSALSSGRNNSTWPAFEAALHNTITTSDGISAAAPASGTSGWFLPSLYQWNMIVKGLSGKTANLSGSSNDDYKASSLNTKITAAGGDGLQGEGGYLSSTEYDGSRAWGFDAYTGGVGNDIKGNGHYVRSAFAF